MTSPTDRASGVTMGVILTPEFGNDQREALCQAVRTYNMRHCNCALTILLPLFALRVNSKTLRLAEYQNR